MRFAFLLLSFYACTLTAFSQQIKRIDNSTISAAALTHKIQYLMDTAHVQGLEISVFNRNEVVYKRAFGYKRIDTKAPLTTHANIYGASLSKVVFTVLVLKLVEEGIINLDKPLQDYLPQPIYTYTPKTKWHDHYADLQTDSLYRKITARMCLDHTSGFPNWRWDMPDQKLRVMFEPGTHYSYSGEGMVYLQIVLEKMLGKPLQTLAAEKIFTPLGMQHSAYQWLPAYEADYAVGHKSNGELYEKDKDNEPRSPSTLETTLDDLTLFITAVLQHKLISAASTQQMFTPQIRLRSAHQFGPKAWQDTTSTANDNISLSYGLGWGLLKSPYGWGAFKEGHGDGFQHYCIIFPEKKAGILIMTNSDNGESIFKELLATAIGDTYTPWEWQYYIPYNLKK